MNSRYLGLVRLPAAVALAAALLSACGGDGGGGGQPPPASVTISGQITFDRIPLDATLGNGLNPAGTVQAPARQVTVQAIGTAAGAAVLASTSTDASGNYSLSVPSNTSLFIRVRAEMIKTGVVPTWNFSVHNNDNSDALYALDGNAASSGTANSTRNLNAPSGFGVNSYTGERAAAPFAILDTVFRAKELVLTATPSTVFPTLSLFWSDQNRPTVGRFCPDDGDIGTSSYIVFGQGELDGCAVPQTNPDGIYILGNFTALGGDTDEFDQSVIAHEFGHYVEDRFGRTDSIGGIHGGSSTLLDLRVAFGEGWGNAFSGMALGGPVYRDTQNGVQTDFSIDMEADDDLNEGWFSEASVGEILWDLFDATNEPGDTVALGFAPLLAVVTGAQVTTDALTSIFTFSTGLRAAQPAAQPAIDTLLAGEDITGTGDFGVGETNDGDGNPSVNNGVLPIYGDIARNDPPITVCSRSPFGHASGNKLGNRVFLRFTNDMARPITIQATGTNSVGGAIPATDPDIFVLRRGTLAAFGAGTGSSETISQAALPAAAYIIEVYDFDVAE
ncbi:MAG: hypothetical protein ACREXP_21380, partial [Steroidobacteraceae bacterium]